ncbi:hypothetical protein BJY24_006354 [Nocardia transvalensis]|uniref:Uncharacterized protein n=1 Tax=Nocardia transvalensis TaxID=37333 RepID=A0A7W9PJZ9_9NOCA|nr:hypothetical protein [Nocardia transvalensis]
MTATPEAAAQPVGATDPSAAPSPSTPAGDVIVSGPRG